MIVNHEAVLPYYKHPYWPELKRCEKEQFRNQVMDKYGKDCGLACYNYEFQRYVTKFEHYFNELIQKLGISTSENLIHATLCWAPFSREFSQK
jgi:hypothetical protein